MSVEPRRSPGPRAYGTPAGVAAHEILLEDYDYSLPEDRIAQEPVSPRDASRLMLLDRGSGTTRHLHFTDLPDLLSPGDLIVLNDTQVFRARMTGLKPTGGRLEFLFLKQDPAAGVWEALCNGSRELREGMAIDFGEGVTSRVLGRREETALLVFPPEIDVAAVLDRRGTTPLPPYIRRGPQDPRLGADGESYQTVYARHRGAVAAPTAGLHFTLELLGRLEERGVGLSFLTLHVGPGTFLPVREKDARRHVIHAETFRYPAEACAAVAEARRRGRRVVAVGTTVARVLEHVALSDGTREMEGECDLFVLPGHRFLRVDALLTNFHLPRSTLLLFAAAFAGRDRILAAYREAVARDYRFYSYGDAMLIL